MRPTITIILLALLAPATAHARWHAPVVVPVPAPQHDTPAAAMAVADDGRAVVAHPEGSAAALGVLAPGASGLSTTPLPGVQHPVALAFAPGESVVGLATTQTGESPGGEASRRGPCCARPTIIRWRPGTAPQLTAVAPERHDDYLLDSLAVDSAATAFFIAHRQPDAAADGADLVARVPLDGAASFRHLNTRRSLDADPVALRASPDAVGATVVWNGGHTYHRLTVRSGRWHPTGRRRQVPRDDYRQDAELTPDGRLVSTFVRRGRLWLRVEGRRPDRDLGAIDNDEGWTTAIGNDGTVAVARAHRARLSVRTMRGGRLGRPRILGSAGANVALAVDADGGVHVAWSRPGRKVTVLAPAGRRTFPGTTLESLVTSPHGATAVQLRAGDRITIAVGTRG